MNQQTQDTIAIVREAGQAVMQFYQSSFTVRDKSPDNPVTEADLASDTLLKRRLGELVPQAGWLSEETADNPSRLEQNWLWVVDPIDGTKEFVMGIPEFSISVALVEAGLPVLGIVFNPATDELFVAERGQGVWCNGETVGVSGRNQLSGSLIDASRSEIKRGEFDPFKELVQLRITGSIAYKLARVASGQADGTWSRGPKHEWDICAGALLVQEAGGVAVDLDGNPFMFNKSWPKVNGIIADNGHLHAAILAALAPHRDTARKD